MLIFFLLKNSLANGHLFDIWVAIFSAKNITKSQANIKKGVNFAYSSATSLEFDYFIRNDLPPRETNNLLKVQFDCFKMLKSSLCKNKDGFVITPCTLF